MSNSIQRLSKDDISRRLQGKIKKNIERWTGSCVRILSDSTVKQFDDPIGV